MPPNPPPGNVVPFRKPRKPWQPPKWLKPWLWQTVTGWVIVANVAIYLAMVVMARGGGILTPFPAVVPERFGLLVPPKVPFEPWRLLTCTFLHANLLHVAMNLLILGYIGPRLETAFGKARFALLYLGAALSGSLASWGWNTLFPGTSLGASGAVNGVIGGLFALSWRAAGWHSPLTKQWLYWSVGMVLAGVFLSRSGVDNAAHVGGWLGGAGIAYLFAGRQPWKGALERATLAAGSLAVVASLGLALTTGSTGSLALGPADVAEAEERVEAGEYELAEIAAAKAISAHEGDAYETSLRILRAYSLLKLERKDEAVVELASAEKSGPAPHENAAIAELWEIAGDLEKARKAAYRAKLEDSRYAPLHERLKALGEASPTPE